jgi:purine-binding chemotaxis protein CheW
MIGSRKSMLPLGPNRPQRDTEQSLVGFVVGPVRYAIEIVHVREIVVPLELTELPHMPKDLAGVADHRSEVLPVLDLRSRFGLLPTADERRKTKWILIVIRGRTLGLIVDHVLGVMRISTSDLRAPPELGGGAETRGLSGVVSYEGSLVFVLDLTRFESVVDSFERARAASLPAIARGES